MKSTKHQAESQNKSRANIFKSYYNINVSNQQGVIMYTFTAFIKIDKYTTEEIDVEAKSLKEAKKKIQEVIDDMYGGTPKVKKIVKRGPGFFC